MPYKLSICIPTYNRAKYLPELLDSIIEQVDANNPVEICISDNASEDNTTELVNKYKEKYPHIVYFKWPSNMGADRNFLKVVEIASGEYCWLMGSDDKLTPGALEKIISYLDRKNDIILFDRILCDINMVRQGGLQKIFEVSSDRKFNLNDDDDFIAYAFYAKCSEALFSYLSCVIFLRSKWVQICCDDRVIGSGYSHVYMLFMYCNKFSKNILLYINQPLVLYRGGNDSFLSSDVAKRVLLDLNGYELIIRLIFFYQPVKYRCLLWVLEKHMKKYVFFKSLLFKRFFSKDETYGLLRVGCKKLFCTSITLDIKFWLCDSLFKLTFLRAVIRKCLYFIKYKVLKRV